MVKKLEKIYLWKCWFLGGGGGGHLQLTENESVFRFHFQPLMPIIFSRHNPNARTSHVRRLHTQLRLLQMDPVWYCMVSFCYAVERPVM